MKKFFTLAIVALTMCLTANAQRKTWDFTKGFSTTTIENLKAAGWTDETANRSIQSGARDEGPLTYTINGAEWTCPETEGLIFHQKSAKHLVFAYDYNNTGFKGSKFLWMNGKKGEDALTIPAVPAGEKVTITYESHSTSENRGFKVSGAFMDAEENQTFTSHGDTVTVVIYNTGSEAADLKLSSTNGHHIYKIIIGEGDAEESQPVIYLYNAEPEANIAELLATREQVEVTAIDVATTTVTTDQLKAAHLVVVGSNIPADNASVAAIKEALPFIPMLNLNANLYAAWGYGEATVSDFPVGEVKNAKSKLLADIEVQTEGEMNFIQLAEGTPLTAVTLGDYFLGDDVVLGAMLGEAAVAHVHSIQRNGYIYLPYVTDLTEAGKTLFNNAVTMLLDTRDDICPAPAPSINLEYKNLNTNITLVPSASLQYPHIYYTLDGSEPTELSAEYTGVINVTSPCTVKAVAIGEGYLLSSVNSKEVEILEQPAQPAISQEPLEGKTIVRLSCETPDVEIYYNLTGKDDLTLSSLYTDSIEIIQPTTLYAFAVAGGVVKSEMTSQKINVSNPFLAIDVIAHYSAPAWDGIGNNGSLFSSGMNATSSMYDTEAEPIKGVDPETGDEIDIYPEIDYMVKDEPGDTPEWDVRSKGQVVLFQNNNPSTTNFGDDGGINPERAIDVDSIFVPTKNNIHFYKCHSGEPSNAAIQSKKAFKGPFNIVVLTCMNGNPLVAEVAADSLEWETIGSVTTSHTMSRAWRKVTFSYTGTDEVYVRIDQKGGTSTGPKIYDIYVANQGEKTQALLEQLSGITTVNAPKHAAGIYSLGGVRLSKMQRGLNIVVDEKGNVKKVLYQ